LKENRAQRQCCRKWTNLVSEIAPTQVFAKPNVRNWYRLRISHA